MDRHKVVNLQLQRELVQIVDLVVTQLSRRPPCRSSSICVELLKSESPDNRQIVVPGNPDMVVFSQQSKASRRVWAVSDKISQLPNLKEASVTAGMVDHTASKSTIVWIAAA